jgi:preprotein translocase subunit SecA
MAAEQVSENIVTLREKVIAAIVERYVPVQSLIEQWNIEGLEATMRHDFNFTDIDIHAWLATEPALNSELIKQRIVDRLIQEYQQRNANLAESVVQHLEKVVMLQQLDQHWKEHLGMMDYLRQSVGLRGYAQKDPKQEYKREAFNLFQEMLARLEYQIISILAMMRAAPAEEVEILEERRHHALSDNIKLHHDPAANILAPTQEAASEAQKVEQRVITKVGRNDPCPCGSGKKFKQCHGKLE